MTALVVTLPLRVRNTSNLREFWAVKAKRNASHRAAVTMVLRHVDLPPLPATVTLTRVGKRDMDFDGVVVSLKACRDAVAAAYGVDDGPKGPIRWEYQQERGEYAVRITIEGVR